MLKKNGFFGRKKNVFFLVDGSFFVVNSRLIFHGAPLDTESFWLRSSFGWHSTDLKPPNAQLTGSDPRHFWVYGPSPAKSAESFFFRPASFFTTHAQIRSLSILGRPTFSFLVLGGRLPALPSLRPLRQCRDATGTHGAITHARSFVRSRLPVTRRTERSPAFHSRKDN